MTAPIHPSPTPRESDPSRTLRILKTLALGVTALATAGVTGVVLVAQADAGAQATDQVVVETSARSGPVVTAQDPFFDRGTASTSNGLRQTRRIMLRSRGS